MRYSELSPVQLVRECVGSKDPDAWLEFIRRFQPVIGAAILRTSRPFGDSSRQLLDDLVQDTYLKLCENDCRMLRRFEPDHEGAIFGFLKVVAQNVARDHFKSALAGKRGASQTDALDEPVQAGPKTAVTDGAAEVSFNLQMGEIEETLREITVGKDQERKCIIFHLRYRQGFTASEIAAMPSIGLTTEGVESVLLRLLNMIRGHINIKRDSSG